MIRDTKELRQSNTHENVIYPSVLLEIDETPKTYFFLPIIRKQIKQVNYIESKEIDFFPSEKKEGRQVAILLKGGEKEERKKI